MSAVIGTDSTNRMSAVIGTGAIQKLILCLCNTNTKCDLCLCCTYFLSPKFNLCINTNLARDSERGNRQRQHTKVTPKGDTHNFATVQRLAQTTMRFSHRLILLCNLTQKMLVLLYNMRARMVGINQIRNTYMRHLNRNANEDIWF